MFYMQINFPGAHAQIWVLPYMAGGEMNAYIGLSQFLMQIHAKLHFKIKQHSFYFFNFLSFLDQSGDWSCWKIVQAAYIDRLFVVGGMNKT